MEGRSRARSRQAILAIALAAFAWSIPTAAPIALAEDGAEGVLIEWDFRETEEPWTYGVAGPKGSSNWGTAYNLEDREDGIIQLDGTGNRSKPNAWIYLTLTIPGGATRLQWEASGHDRAGADTNMRVRLVQSGDSTTLFDQEVRGGDDYRFRTYTEDITAFAGKQVTLYFEQNDNGPGENEQLAIERIAILGTVPCAISGLVTDGQSGLDPHANPLPGIRVQLWQDGVTKGPAVATKPDGRYCIPQLAGVTDPGNYKVRATLVDALHEPPLLQTRREADTEAAWTEIPVAASDFGSEHIDVTFTATADRPWLVDLAFIHWHSARFVTWTIDKLALSPAAFGSVTVAAFNDAGATSYANGIAHIRTSDSGYVPRGGPTDKCPENCEWHEIAHHIGDQMGIALTTQPGPCQPRIAHGGWQNKSTCDSLAEGFATFLPVLASYDIYPGSAAYATPDYASFGVNLEDNGYKPWSTEAGGGETRWREDFAVAQLLWDLADASAAGTTGEFEEIALGGSPDATHTTLYVEEKVALGGIELVHIMDGSEPQTVLGLLSALKLSPDVPNALDEPDPDYDPETIPQDISALDQVFLMHGFHPVRDTATPRFDLGDLPAFTDHVRESTGSGLVERGTIEDVPGAAIKLVNSTTAEQTFSVDVTYPGTSSHFELVVPAGSEELFPLHLPPYAPGLLAGADLPECGAPGHRLVTVAISAPSVEPRTIDNCAYLRAVAASAGEPALTYGEAPAVATGAPTAAPTAGSGSESPVAGTGVPIIGVAIVAALAVLLIGFGVWRSRKRGAATGR